MTRDELIELIQQQSRLIEELRKQLEELRRKSQRQANPFSKNKPKADPKKPGRTARQGRFENRSSPPQRPTDHNVEASTPKQCPRCGGEVDLERIDTATTTDLPPIPEPKVTRFAVPVCRCRQCGQQVRGQAPGLATSQVGATAHRLGPGVMAMAHLLHYDLGIPVRKVPQVLLALTGISVTSSAITQDALRKAEGGIGENYDRLRASMRRSAVVHTDDTGWRIGGRNAFLMGFDADSAAVYQIRFRHRNEEVREIIPVDFSGVLVSDRGKSYDAEVFASMRQQKCLGHVLRNISLVLETKRGPARKFGLTLKALLREAMQLAKAAPTEGFGNAVQDLQLRLSRHLRNRILNDDDNQRLLNGIGVQMDRERLLTFLHHQDVEPTNNRAERMLRPAVIARKVSHCSKNLRGAHATAAFLSVIQSSRKPHPPQSQAALAAALRAIATPSPPAR